jgi:hypothetical protein
MIAFDDARRLLVSLLYDPAEEIVDLEPIYPKERERLMVTSAAAVIESILCEIAHSADDAKVGLDNLVVDMKNNIDERWR